MKVLFSMNFFLIITLFFILEKVWNFSNKYKAKLINILSIIFIESFFKRTQNTDKQLFNIQISIYFKDFFIIIKRNNLVVCVYRS